MKVYKCDACGTIIENPYSAKMKEFYIGCDHELECVFPCKTKIKRKIHLCDKCFHNLININKK